MRMIAARSLWPGRTVATSLSRTGTPPATTPEADDEALSTDDAAAIELALPVAAATRAICWAALSAAPPPALCVGTWMSANSSTMCKRGTVRHRRDRAPCPTRPPQIVMLHPHHP